MQFIKVVALICFLVLLECDTEFWLLNHFVFGFSAYYAVLPNDDVP